MANNKVALSIIIVNWNSKDYVRKCLRSVYAHSHGLSFEIIVVDSASHDGCGEMLASEFPDVRFIQSEQNIGFANANNMGAVQARGECLLFLNPDTELVNPAINLLFEALTGLKDAGAVGARLLNGDGSLQTSCIQAFPTILNQLLDAEAIRRRFPKAFLWGIAPLYSKQVELAEVEAISGACIMMKRDVFMDIGCFSVDYFMYAEDMDLCYKAARKGRVNYYVPGAVIIHHGDGSVQNAKSNFATIMAVESLWRYFKKYRGVVYASIFRGGLLLSGTGRLLLLTGRRSLSPREDQHSFHKASWNKWTAIMRWATGRERWVLKYR